MIAHGVCASASAAGTNDGTYARTSKWVKGDFPCQGDFKTAFPTGVVQMFSEPCVPALSSERPAAGFAFIFGETNISIPSPTIAPCKMWDNAEASGFCSQLDLFSLRLSKLDNVMIDSPAEVDLLKVDFNERKVCPVCATLHFGDDDGGGGDGDDDGGGGGGDAGYYSTHDDDGWEWNDGVFSGSSGSSGSGLKPAVNCSCIMYHTATVSFRAEIGNSMNITRQQRWIDDMLDGHHNLGLRTSTVTAVDGGPADTNGQEDNGGGDPDSGGGGNGMGNGMGMGSTAGGSSSHRWLWRSDFESTPVGESPVGWITRDGRNPMIVTADADPYRGRVLSAVDCSWGGNAFSAATFGCSAEEPCSISYYIKGGEGTQLWQGFSNEFPGPHSWVATPGPSKSP